MPKYNIIPVYFMHAGFQVYFSPRSRNGVDRASSRAELSTNISLDFLASYFIAGLSTFVVY